MRESKPMELKPFNYEEAKAGKPWGTSDMAYKGTQVELFRKAADNCKIVATLVEMTVGTTIGYPVFRYENGRVLHDYEAPGDLAIWLVKKVVWGNLIVHLNRDRSWFIGPYATREEAENAANVTDCTQCITFSVEVEE